MCQQQFQAEVMDQLKQEEEFDFADDELVCIYCGSPKGSSYSCCGESHFDTWRNVNE